MADELSARIAADNDRRQAERMRATQVRIVGIMIPFSELLLISLQLAIIQAILVGVGFVALKILGVL